MKIEEVHPKAHRQHRADSDESSDLKAERTTKSLYVFEYISIAKQVCAPMHPYQSHSHSPSLCMLLELADELKCKNGHMLIKFESALNVGDGFFIVSGLNYGVITG